MKAHIFLDGDNSYEIKMFGDKIATSARQSYTGRIDRVANLFRRSWTKVTYITAKLLSKMPDHFCALIT